MNIEGIHNPDVAAETTENVEVTEVAVDPRDEQIRQLQEECSHLKDQMLRSMAEAQNVQRRLRQQIEDDKKFAGQGLVERILPVLDSFERTLLAAESGASAESLLDGVRIVDKQLRSALELSEVIRIPSVGNAFNAELHDAIAVLETEEIPDDVITDEIESGFTMHGRVIRPAKVRVARKP